jgi:hypothetical protein
VRFRDDDRRRSGRITWSGDSDAGRFSRRLDARAEPVRKSRRGGDAGAIAVGKRRRDAVTRTDVIDARSHV